MNFQNAITWLMEHAGPVIQYRTVTELLDRNQQEEYDIDSLYSELFANPYVQSWMLLKNEQSKGTPLGVHGYKKNHLENFIPVMVQLGIKSGNPFLDKWASPFLKFLSDTATGRNEYDDLKTFIAPFLAMAGYHDKYIIDVLKQQVNAIHNTIKKKGFDIYVDPASYPKMPHNFRFRPLVNPAITQDPDMGLPTIYGLFGFSVLQQYGFMGNEQQKLDNLIDYILSPRYQQFHARPIHLMKNNKYYGMEYLILLQGYNQNPITILNSGDTRSLKFLMAVYLMAHFPIAVNHKWFQNSIEYLFSYEIGDSIFQFPLEFLAQKNNGYWIYSSYMSLGENRRNKLWRELESTFWMLKIIKTSGTYSKLKNS